MPISNPAASKLEISYQQQFQQMSAKGYLTEEEVEHLARLNNKYIGLNELKLKYGRVSVINSF
ncbi:MAG: hypothetical protein ACJA13_002271 [Paraglaciecola sp.]|jgi:hypothetical protein